MKLPSTDNRTAVIGSTGSGKTQFAVWLLSTRDWLFRPWYVIDYKRDKLINSIGATVIDVRSNPPTKPGIYLIQPTPNIDDDALTDFLWKVWALEYCGVYVDEGYMIKPHNPALNALLTQGRSKNIEMIVLAQRPVWTSKFVFSEANNFAVLNLTVADDRKYIANYLGGNVPELLPKYFALWYEADTQNATILRPVPARRELIGRFAALKEQPRRQLI